MRAAPLLLLLGCSAALAQPTSLLQDLSVQTVATGLSHAGSMEVDGQGNVWLVQIQGPVGGTGGFLTQVTPSGAVTTNLGAPLSEMGSLRRNAAGNIYFWMNTGAILADLCQLFPGGGIGTVQSYIGYQGLGIAIDLASDEIYLGTKSTSPQAGIHRRAPIGGALTPVSPGIASSSQTHLVLDTQGNLYVSNGGDVRRVTATGTTTVYTPGPSVQIQSLNVGVFDHLLAVEHTIVSPTVFSARVVSITPEGLVAPLVDLGPVPPSPPPVACLDLAGTGIYVLSQGALYHITGPFTLLSVGSSAPGFLKARLDTLGTAPFVLAADVPGISFSIPGWGTFNTSLGTGPGWILLFDSIGIFHLPDPISTPWSQTVTAPPPQGLTLSFQAYVVDVAAANGIIAISGPAILQF